MRASFPDRHHPTGFTLVETLVSIALGATILLATTQLFVDGRESFQVQQQWLSLHEQGRHALQFLTTELRRAGYPAGSFSGTALSATNNSGDNRSDSLTIRYQGAHDCAGSSARSILYALVDHSLRCDGNGGASPTPQTLSSQVGGLQFRFGADLDGDRSVDRYLDGDQVADWGQIRTVDIGLLLQSDQPARQQEDSNRYEIFGVTHGPYNDYRLRKIYRTTVQLRNQ
jgi:type IV pilus assembly protein PilW